MYLNSFIKNASDFLSKKYRCKKHLLDYIGLWELREANLILALFNVTDPRSPSYRSTVAYKLSNR